MVLLRLVFKFIEFGSDLWLRDALLIPDYYRPIIYRKLRPVLPIIFHRLQLVVLVSGPFALVRGVQIWGALAIYVAINYILNKFALMIFVFHVIIILLRRLILSRGIRKQARLTNRRQLRRHLRQIRGIALLFQLLIGVALPILFLILYSVSQNA